MLKVFFGSDRQQVVDKTLATAKNISSHPITIDEQNFYPGQFSELVGASSLFGEVGVYIIDTPSSNTELETECTSALKDMAESQNNFFIIEGSLLAPVKKKLTKYADSSEEFSADKPERFNTFGLADALAKRDKKTLWLLSQEAFLVGIKEEEVIGVLWWQLKALKLARVTASATEAGMKDFPYRKAKQALSKFSDSDLNQISRNLLSLYHLGHKGKTDIRLALERWILTM